MQNSVQYKSNSTWVPNVLHDMLAVVGRKSKNFQYLACSIISEVIIKNTDIPGINVTLRRVRVLIFCEEKQYVLNILCV